MSISPELIELQISCAQAAIAIHPSRGAVVHEAFEWLNTPYGNCGNVKGEGGFVDCAMLLVEIFRQQRGPVPVDYDPRPYNSQWHLHQDEERYLAGLGQWATRIEAPQAGDIIMYRFGKHASHGALVVSEELIVHAHKDLGKVSLCERSALAHRASSYWTIQS